MYVTATPGKFMMRLRVPNGILNSQQLRYFADVVEPYGPEVMMMIVMMRMMMMMMMIMMMILLHACTYINCRIRMVVFGLIDVIVVVVVVGLIDVIVVVVAVSLFPVDYNLYC